VEKARGIPTMAGLDLASRVSNARALRWSKPVEPCSPSDLLARPPEARHHVVAYDTNQAQYSAAAGAGGLPA